MGRNDAVVSTIAVAGMASPADFAGAIAVVKVDPVWPGGECRGLVEPLEHSVVGVPIKVGHSSVDRVAVPNPIEHFGVRGTADPPSDSQLMLHLKISGDGNWSAGPSV